MDEKNEQKRFVKEIKDETTYFFKFKNNLIRFRTNLSKKSKKELGVFWKMKDHKLVKGLKEKKNEYFNIIFEDNEDHMNDYKHEFGRIMKDMNISATVIEKCTLSKDFPRVMAGILLNESLTYLDKNDVKKVMFYKLEVFIKNIMHGEG